MIKCGEVYDHMKANNVSLRPETYATYMKVRLGSAAHPSRCLVQDGTLSDPVEKCAYPGPACLAISIRCPRMDEVGSRVCGLQGLYYPWNDASCPDLGRLVGINSVVSEVKECSSVISWVALLIFPSR